MGVVDTLTETQIAYFPNIGQVSYTKFYRRSFDIVIFTV